MRTTTTCTSWAPAPAPEPACDGHWMLETGLIIPNEANDPNVKFATGQLTEDGVLQNEPFG